ncbi:GxxExxY protein [Acidobacteria bacterium AH-259-G07]|nr:GxxExxY protein [Acidobacteria bacterium AH-259-G07]
MSFLYQDLSYEILGCAFDVYNELGPFLRESIYQRAMEIALSDKGLKWERQKSVPIQFRNQKIGTGLVDLLVEENVILELKAVDMIHPVFISQLVQYLSTSGLPLGYILNFGSIKRLQYQRVILSANIRVGSA